MILAARILSLRCSWRQGQRTQANNSPFSVANTQSRFTDIMVTNFTVESVTYPDGSSD
jgi:hypothetical protein